MKKYQPKHEDLARLANNHKYHRPHADDQSVRYERIRAETGQLGIELLGMCPPSRELSVALTKLEEVMFWANAAIARNERPPEPREGLQGK